MSASCDSWCVLTAFMHFSMPQVDAKPHVSDVFDCWLQKVTQQELHRVNHPAAAAVDLQKHASLT